MCHDTIHSHKIGDIIQKSFVSIPTKIGEISATEAETDNYTTCLDPALKCLYDITKTHFARILKHCQNGEHLDFCEMFECSSTYKCPGYYCLPWRYVCDGFWDCPLGHDEIDCEDQYRSNFFHCSSSTIKILLQSICDNITDCPVGDDETNCQIHKTVCPSSCVCLLYSLYCEGVGRSSFTSSTYVPAFQVSIKHFLSLEAMLFALQFFPSVVYLNISHSNLPKYCFASEKLQLNKLVGMQAHNDSIISLGSKCFEIAHKMETLDLSENKISQMSCEAFYGLSCLKKLILSENRLTELKNCYFGQFNTNIDFVNLMNNKLKYLEMDSFEYFSSGVIIKASYPAVCCLRFDIICSVYSYIPTSCDMLLKSYGIEFTAQGESTIGIILNILALLIFRQNYQLLSDSERSSSITTCTVLISSLLLCSSLLGLSLVNRHFEDAFQIKKCIWKESYFCSFFYVMSSVSIYCYNSSVVSFTISRLMVVLYPMESSFKDASFSKKVFIFQFAVFSTTAATLCFVSFNGDETFVPDTCLPVGRSLAVMSKITSGCLASLAFLSCFLVAFLYFKLIQSLRKHAGTLASNQSKIDISKVKMNAFLAVATNCVCWLPTSTTIFLTLFGGDYHDKMLLWTLVAVLPTGTLTYPFLFANLVKNMKIFCSKTKP